MSGASRTLIPCRCACSTTSSTAALVEVGLGEDQLVGPHLLEHDAGARPASRASVEPGNGLGCDDADELVREPAARRRELTRCRRTRLSPAPTSTTRRRIPAARMSSSETRLVRGAQQADRERRRRRRTSG